MCSNEMISPPAFSCPAAHFESRGYPYESKQLKNKMLRTLQYSVFINNLTLSCVLVQTFIIHYISVLP